MVDVEEARDKLSGGWPAAAAAAAAVAHRPLTLDLVHEAQLKKFIYFRYGGDSPSVLWNEAGRQASQDLMSSSIDRRRGGTDKKTPILR